jgi:ankyrin repeat protein
LIEGSFGDGPDWKTSLIGAAISGEKLDLLKILLDQGGQTMFERRYGLSILGKTAFSCCIASRRSASTICAMLLCLIEMPEFDINAGLKQSRPLSMLAKGSFDKSIIPDVLSTTLRRADLEVNYRESDLFCPLQIAAGAGNVDAVKLLLADPRTDVNLSFRDEKRVVPPPIQEAAKLSHLEIVQLFLDSPRLEIKAMDVFSGPLEDAVTATRSAFVYCSIASEFDQSYVEIVRALFKRKDVDVNRISIAASPLNIAMSAIKRREYEKNDLLEKKEFTQKMGLIRRMEKYLPRQKRASWKDYLFGEDWHDNNSIQEYLDGQIVEHDKRHYDEEKNTLKHRIKTLEDEIEHRKVIALILRDNGARSFDSLTERSDADWDKVQEMSVAYLSGIRFLWGLFKQAI